MSDQIKMTIGLPEAMESMQTGIAEADGVTKTEYVRNLIESDLQARQRQYRLLKRVFDNPTGEVKRVHERAQPSSSGDCNDDIT
jgi:hypothetical protein